MQNGIDVLWAKKSKTDFEGWLPLIVHMSDAAQVSTRLWNSWVSRNIKELIQANLPSTIEAEKLFIFLAGVHDVGKACPAFQCRSGRDTPKFDNYFVKSLRDAGFTVKGLCNSITEVRHWFMSFLILQRHSIDDTISVVVGGHHGEPPEKSQLNTLRTGYKYESGVQYKEWLEAQDALYNYALNLAGLSDDALKGLKLPRSVQVLLSGLVIMADWIASDETLFNLFPIGKYTEDSAVRANNAFKVLELPPFWSVQSNWCGLYDKRFSITKTHPLQEVLLDTAISVTTPGLFVVEAPMGGGKTEAALVAAEVLAERLGCRGIYFALPTQATSNAMFERVLSWLKTFDIPDAKPYSVRLSHGRAEFNDTYTDLKFQTTKNGADEEEEVTNVLVHEWLSGRKKGMLSDFAVGTIDHILLAGLKQKHLALRHLGLAGKVVVIDECHAYDCYMESYLLRVLNWLGTYGVPVLILSATLPSSRRQSIVNAYLNTNTDDTCVTASNYPQVTYTSEKQVFTTSPVMQTSPLDVGIKHLSTANTVTELDKVLAEGGYAGVIVNTVKRAQVLYEALVKHFGFDAVTLLHSAFMQVDRSQLEKNLVSELGKANLNRTGKRIVVGTQVFEQSMDIDFDVLFTDLCPMDLLLQRIGRLHRHNRVMRPNKVHTPVCYVLDDCWGAFDAGSISVYGAYLLARTRAVLPEVIKIPGDIPRLVEAVYSEVELSIPTEHKVWYNEALDKDKKKIEKRIDEAGRFQIEGAGPKNALLGWIARGKLDLQDATVRGGIDSVEVILVQKRKSGFYLLPWVNEGHSLPVSVLDESLSKTLAGCAVRLPYVFGFCVEKVEFELKKSMCDAGLTDTWGKSPWLKDMLFLVLDENLSAKLCDYRLSYQRSMGLTYTSL